MKKGKNKYVPPIFLEEMELVKKSDGINSDAEGFRRMAQYAKKGRNAIDLNIWNRIPPRKKKGTLSEIFFVFIVLFFLAIASVVAYYAFDQTINKIIDVPAINESKETKIAFEATYEVINKLDYLVFFVFIAMILGMFVASWYIEGNPLYVWIYFLGLGIAIFVSAILSNVWDSFFITKLLSTRGHFPLTDHLWLFMPYYLAVSGFISMIIMYSKGRMQ